MLQKVPESNYLKKAFSNFGAEVAIDFHEYRPFRKEYNDRMKVVFGVDDVVVINAFRTNEISFKK